MFLTKKKIDQIGKIAGDIAGRIALERFNLLAIELSETYIRAMVQQTIAPLVEKIESLEIAMLDIPLLKRSIDNIPSLLQELRAMTTCLDKEHAKEMHGLFNDIAGKIIDVSKDVDKFHLKIKGHVSNSEEIIKGDVACARLQIESLHKIVCEKFDSILKHIDRITQQDEEVKFHTLNASQIEDIIKKHGDNLTEGLKEADKLTTEDTDKPKAKSETKTSKKSKGQRGRKGTKKKNEIETIKGDNDVS